jgi:antitoxin VapB
MQVRTGPIIGQVYQTLVIIWQGWYLLLVDTTPEEATPMANSVDKKEEVRAKLFVNGRSQAVRLPKEFRFEGNEVRVRRALGGVLLEAVEPKQKPWSTATELFERLAAYGGDPIFPEGREQPEFQERDWNSFDSLK